MSKNYSWAYPLILIGGLAVAGYFIWQYFTKENPITKGTDTIRETIERIYETITVPFGVKEYVNPATGQPVTIKTPSAINLLIPPTGIPGFIDFVKSSTDLQTGIATTQIAKTIGAFSSPTGVEGAKTTLLDFITGGFLKSGAGLISPSTTTPKTLITTPTATYVAKSPVVGINWQSVGSQISPQTKDLFSFLQAKILEQRGIVDLKPIGTEMVSTSSVREPVTVINMGIGTPTTVSSTTQIVPKATTLTPTGTQITLAQYNAVIRAPTTTIKPTVTPVVTSVVSQPSYITGTSAVGTGAYRKPGGM